METITMIWYAKELDDGASGLKLVHHKLIKNGFNVFIHTRHDLSLELFLNSEQTVLHFFYELCKRLPKTKT